MLWLIAAFLVGARGLLQAEAEPTTSQHRLEPHSQSLSGSEGTSVALSPPEDLRTRDLLRAVRAAEAFSLRPSGHGLASRARASMEVRGPGLLNEWFGIEQRAARWQGRLARPGRPGSAESAQGTKEGRLVHWAQCEGFWGNAKFEGKSVAELKELEPELKRIIARDAFRAVQRAQKDAAGMAAYQAELFLEQPPSDDVKKSWAFTMATDVLGSYDELGEDPFFGVFIARAERMEAEIMSKDANPNVLTRFRAGIDKNKFEEAEEWEDISRFLREDVLRFVRGLDEELESDVADILDEVDEDNENLLTGASGSELSGDRRTAPVTLRLALAMLAAEYSPAFVEAAFKTFQAFKIQDTLRLEVEAQKREALLSSLKYFDLKYIPNTLDRRGALAAAAGFALWLSPLRRLLPSQDGLDQYGFHVEGETEVVLDPYGFPN